MTATTLYILNDVLGGFTINGKGFPATAALHRQNGRAHPVPLHERGDDRHPMHLHGLTLRSSPRTATRCRSRSCATRITVAPGGTLGRHRRGDNPGVWAFHCHILNHAESPHGMFGMVTVLIVE